MHNHPSGIPTASSGDKHVTGTIENLAAKHNVNFKGHVIINSGSYCFLRNGYESYHDYSPAQQFAPSTDGITGSTINSADVLAALSKKIQNYANAEGDVLISTTSQYQVKSIITAPNLNTPKLKYYLKHLSSATGLAGNFVSLGHAFPREFDNASGKYKFKDPEKWKYYKHLNDSGIVDIVDADGVSYRYAVHTTQLPYDYQPSYHIPEVRQHRTIEEHS